MDCEIAIVGAGAAGLTTAIFAAEAAPQARVVVLDTARAPGAKILVSGGGRCNVTHDVVTADDFNGSRNIVRHVLAAFGVKATVEWFKSLGVELKQEETGKLFPTTDSARTVLNALLQRCAQLGITIRGGTRISGIAGPTIDEKSFALSRAEGVLRAARVVLATGGRSLPRSGSDGSGWDLVRALGHSVTATYPALVPLVLDPRMFHAELSGIALEVELSTFAEGKRIDCRCGSLLWTHFGISGPVVMDASRHWVIARELGQAPVMQCNLLTPDGFEAVDQWLVSQAAARPRTSMGNIVGERLAARVAGAVIKYAGIDPATACAQVPREARRRLVHALTALPLPVSQARGWNYAEVTAGGVPLNEINFRTMESRKQPGLYLAGEILDCDGRIGGFNFQWAWSTGYLAGRAAANSSCEGN